MEEEPPLKTFRWTVSVGLGMFLGMFFIAVCAIMVYFDVDTKTFGQF